MVALVTTFIAESLLVRVREPPMPWQEVAGIVNCQCLLDVSDDKVIKLCRSREPSCLLLLLLHGHNYSREILRQPTRSQESSGANAGGTERR